MSSNRRSGWKEKLSQLLPEFSAPRRARGRTPSLLEDPDLLDRAAGFMDDLGLCGEELNRRVVFLAGVGGMLGEPIHLVIKGDSAGGKNTLAKTAFKLLPDESVRSTSGLTPQALTYLGTSDEKEGVPRVEGVLLIDEAEGIKGAEYTLRQAMSEGRVGRLTVGQNGSGGWSGKKLEVEVSASIITTTTATALHRENQTRVFDVWIDETPEQTRRVIRAQALRAVGGTEGAEEVSAGLEEWRTALASLRPARVSVPFARPLAEAFPIQRPRARRDFERILSLIRVSALLHQKQREVRDRTVVASVDDYRVVHPLLPAVLEPSMRGLNETALRIAELQAELAEEGDGWVKRTVLEDESAKRGIARSPNTVRKWCGQLDELGYWEGRRAGPYSAWTYRKVRDPHEEPLALPRPDELREGPEGPGRGEVPREAAGGESASANGSKAESAVPPQAAGASAAAG